MSRIDTICTEREMRTITPRALYTNIPAETAMVVLDGTMVGLFIPLTEDQVGTRQPVEDDLAEIGDEVVLKRKPVLGEVTPAGPVAKHGSQDELDAARKARSEALNEARRKAQEQRDGWLKKMGKAAT